MRVQHRKWVLMAVIVVVLITSRIYEIADRLQWYGLVDSARDFERTYMTGTTFAVVAVLVLLMRDSHHRPF